MLHHTLLTATIDAAGDSGCASDINIRPDDGGKLLRIVGMIGIFIIGRSERLSHELVARSAAGTIDAATDGTTLDVDLRV